MDIKISYMLDNNPFLKMYLHNHSNYYKNIIRNPLFIDEIMKVSKKEYHLTFPDKLEKIKNNISFINTFMDVLK